MQNTMKENELLDELNQIITTDDAKELLNWDRKYAFHPHQQL
jgi:hypothetical protein